MKNFKETLNGWRMEALVIGEGVSEGKDVFGTNTLSKEPVVKVYDQRGHAYDEYMANELAKYSFEDWELPEKNVRELLEKGVTWIDH